MHVRNKRISPCFVISYFVAIYLCCLHFVTKPKKLQLVTRWDIMSTFGQLQEYTAEVENIWSYLERVESFYTANGIVKGKQVPCYFEHGSRV